MGNRVEQFENLIKSGLSAAELNKLLLDAVPEISAAFDEETSWQEGMETGSHIVFEDVLSRFVIENSSDKKLVQKIFDFVEKLLDLDDFYATNVVTVSFVEPLVFNTDPRCFFEFAKEKTQKIMQECIENKLNGKF